jgi:3-hydroxyisobutyrate dehydrogenase-like beta-hydroxyacid dehydrogenase
MAARGGRTIDWGQQDDQRKIVTRVGFIGLGEQGMPMAANLAKAGFDLMVYDLRPEPMAEMAALGAKTGHSPAEVAHHAEIIEIIVVDDTQVQTIALGEGGVIANSRPGTIVAIHSTIRPSTVCNIADYGAARGVVVIDAAVSGGPHGARSHTLCYMIGGSEHAVERCRPLFETSGNARTIFHVGNVGAGMTAKLAHQVIICLNILAAHEGMLLGQRARVDLNILQEIVRAGGAQSRIADNWVRHRPPPAAGRLFFKDLALALESAHELGLGLPGAAMAQQLMEKILGSSE